MPCSDGYNPGRTTVVHDDHYERILKKRLDDVTSILCETCKVLSKNDGVYPGLAIQKLGVPRLPEWWAMHQAEDKAREARERESKKTERLQKIRQFNSIAKDLGTLGIRVTPLKEE